MSAVAQSKAIRVAVVGCGEFGRNHARVYGEMESANLVGVFDTDATRAEKFAAEFEATVFRSLGELQGAVDAASVAVPTNSHDRVGGAVMVRAIDVLGEKPMEREAGGGAVAVPRRD